MLLGVAVVVNYLYGMIMWLCGNKEECSLWLFYMADGVLSRELQDDVGVTYWSGL